jgi:hypothetical protein
MAVTQDVIIRVIYESDLKDGIKEVEQLGTAAKKDIDVFKSLSKEISLGMNDALKEAGVSSKQLADAVTKAGKSGEGFKSLKVQIREAREEAQLLSQKFGDTSTEAINAQKKIATLTDELDDFNNRVKALNPEAKFKAFGQVAQGGIGALQGLTGAMQIFGSENEEVNKIIQKFQGFINVTQGIESIAGLSDSFKSLKVILGLTTVSQSALATATEVEAVAATQAATANYAFAASLSATGIGAIVVAIGLLIGAWMKLEGHIDDATEAGKVFERQQRLQAISQNAFDKKYKETLDDITSEHEFQLKLLEAQGVSEDRLLKTKIKFAEAELQANRNAIATGKSSAEFSDQLVKDNKELVREITLYNAELNKVPDAAQKASKAVKEIAVKDTRTDQELMNSIGLPTAQQVNTEMQKVYSGLKDNTDDFLKSEEQKRAGLIATRDVTLQGAVDLSNQLNALSQQDADIKIANLDRQLQAGLISEKEYATQVTQIKRKQAEQDKKIALFNAAIGIAQAIINALAVPPAPNIAAAALASALGAAKLATIVSLPIPQFNKGTLSVDGVDTGKDSVLAMLRPKEAVIPVDMKQAYLPTLQAMFDGSIKPSELNAMVTQKRTGKTNKSDNGLAELGHIFKSNKSTSIRNADELANKIADAIARKANIRWNL